MVAFNTFLALKALSSLIICEDILCMNNAPCLRLSAAVPKEVCICPPNFYGSQCQFDTRLIEETLSPKEAVVNQKLGQVPTNQYPFEETKSQHGNDTAVELVQIPEIISCSGYMGHYLNDHII